MKNLYILPLLLLVFSCVEEFKYPLDVPTNSFIDEKLIGTWQYKDKTEIGYLHIYRLNNNTNQIK